MPLNAFIVRPFGRKSFHLKPDISAELLEAAKDLVQLPPVAAGEPRSVTVNFDMVQSRLIEPALVQVGIRGSTTASDIAAGNIREDMFNRLLTADLVLADVSIHNPNVFYELGIRQAFRDRHTFVLRSNLSDYPFDLQTDRYFDYDLTELAKAPERQIGRLADALRATIASSRPDSPVFRMLPTLESVDRGRFIAVPDEFHEEVERARRRGQRDMLSVLAIECEGMLWEVEGLRAVARAQFESNFMNGARVTWETIVNRYPDDVEGNISLSTIYQRMFDSMRSQQVLARVSRVRSQAPSRQSELGAHVGRNLKEAWIAAWQSGPWSDTPREGNDTQRQQQRAALLSPLLQLAFTACMDAFKLDLNNSLAGLEALTLLTIQTDLALRYPDDWESMQSQPGGGLRSLAERQETIRMLIPALKLAIEADRERLGRLNQVDPWFYLLEAAAMCIISTKPLYVRSLFKKALHFAPLSAIEPLRHSLWVLERLGVQGGNGDDTRSDVGTICDNVSTSMRLLETERVTHRPKPRGQRILLFIGLGFDGASGDVTTPMIDPESQVAVQGSPVACEEAVRRAIRSAICQEFQVADDSGVDTQPALVIAAGASGGDIIFHEQLRDVLAERAETRAASVPVPPRVRLCLALPRAAYVGQYVAPAGGPWVDRFAAVYRQCTATANLDADDWLFGQHQIAVLGAAPDMPRWLHTRQHYDVGRRNNLWMLQHALSQADEFDEDTQITMLVLVPSQLAHGPSRSCTDDETALGSVHDMLRRAAAHGIKVVPIPVTAPSAADDVSPSATVLALARQSA